MTKVGMMIVKEFIQSWCTGVFYPLYSYELYYAG